MAVKTKQLTRVFKFGKKELTDVNTNMTPKEILNVYSNQYPSLANATISGPKIENNKAVYTFSESVGTKG